MGAQADGYQQLHKLREKSDGRHVTDNKITIK